MTARDDALAEEIAWLRGFGWRPERIAQRLGVKRKTVEHYVYGKGSLTPQAATAYLSGQQLAREGRMVGNDARHSRLDTVRTYRTPIATPANAASPEVIEQLVDAICPRRTGRAA